MDNHTYDFSWIDKKVEEFKKYNKNPDYTVKQFIESIIYPHGIFMWFMPGEQAIMGDVGGNNFVGDTDNYLIQLKKYVKKFDILPHLKK